MRGFLDQRHDRSSKAQSSKFGNVQDSIFFYTRGEEPLFNIQRVPHSDDYIQSHYRYIDERTGKKYRLDNFTQAGQGPSRTFADRELSPPPGKHWIWSQERIDEGMKEGLIVYDIRIGVYGTGSSKGKTHDHGSGFRVLKNNIYKVFKVEEI